MSVNLNVKTVKKYLKDNQAIIEVSRASELVASRAILSAVEIMRDEIRVMVEEHPKRNEYDLTEDLVFRLGMVNMANLVLRMPKAARELLESLPSGSES